MTGAAVLSLILPRARGRCRAQRDGGGGFGSIAPPGRFAATLPAGGEGS
jgi:hypothetical protein